MSSSKPQSQSIIKGKLHPKSCLHYMASKYGDGEEVKCKGRMCVDYTDLNKVCPKDIYLLPSIDRLVDNTVEYKLLNFLYAYYG